MATPRKPKELHLPDGRPTDYRDHYPELLIQRMGREGFSVVRFCAELEIAKQTFYVWLDKHPELNDAFQKARNMCEAYWEKEVLNLWTAEKVNSPLVKLYMANRFDWHDKKDTTVAATVKHEEQLKDLI